MSLFAQIVACFAVGRGRTYLEDPNQEHPQQEYTYRVDVDSATRVIQVTVLHDDVELFCGSHSDGFDQIHELIAKDEQLHIKD